MLEAVEKRFNASAAPSPVHWLSDNGSRIGLGRRSSSQCAWASFRALHQCAAFNRTAWPKRIARQSTWQGRVNQDGKGSRGIWIMPLMIVAGKRYVEG